MGNRDVRNKETKKPKKGSVKPVTFSAITTPPPVVEVIKKGKKPPAE
jgi:hypothetical protein